MGAVCLPKLDVCGSSGGRAVSLLELSETHLYISCNLSTGQLYSEAKET